MVNIPKGEEILMQGFDESYELIVIGCGAAGLVAALSASETMSEATNGDFSIAVLEHAPREERGGNTRWTGAYLRLKDTSTLVDRFVEDMLEFSGGLSDERYIRTLAEKAPETISWIQDKGVQFDYLPTIFPTLKEPRLLPLGGGAAIIETLAQHVEVLCGCCGLLADGVEESERGRECGFCKLQHLGCAEPAGNTSR
jgi:tricarballylate dehydrogenase